MYIIRFKYIKFCIISMILPVNYDETGMFDLTFNYCRSSVRDRFKFSFIPVSFSINLLSFSHVWNSLCNTRVMLNLILIKKLIEILCYDKFSMFLYFIFYVGIYSILYV